MRRFIGALRTVLRRGGREEGAIGLLGLGLTLCIGMLLSAGVCVGTAQLARVDVLDAADHASAAAADRLSEAALYRDGVDHAVLDPAAVRSESASQLSATPLPAHVSAWSVTGVDVEGQQLTVRVRATVRPPVIGSLLAALGAPISVDVTSRADAHLQR